MSFLFVPVKRLGLATVVGIIALALPSIEDAQAYKFDILDGQTCAAEKVHIPSSPNLMVYADSSASMREPGVSGVTESIVSPVNTAGTIDEGLQVEAANAPGNPENRPGISLSHNAVIPPYAWIANTFY